MIQRLSHTTVFVLDQEEALKFYRDKLGFEVRTDATMEGGFRWLTVGPKTQPELEMALMKVAEGPMCDAETAATLQKLLKKGTFSVGVFETADCRKTYATASDAGTFAKIGEMPGGFARMQEDDCRLAQQLGKRRRQRQGLAGIDHTLDNRDSLGRRELHSRFSGQAEQISVSGAKLLEHRLQSAFARCHDLEPCRPRGFRACIADGIGRLAAIGAER